MQQEELPQRALNISKSRVIYAWPPLQVQLMCRYLNPTGRFKGVMEVPDPYYGVAKGFELVRVL